MVAYSAFGAETSGWRWWMSAMFAVVLLLHAVGVNAAPDTPERIAWRKTPIDIELAVGTERLVHLPSAAKVGVPPQLQGALRVQSIDGTLYLLASQLVDGVYVTTEEGPVFHPVKAPTAEQLHTLLHQIIQRIMKCLTRQGYLIEEPGMTYLADTEADAAMAPLQSAACTYRIALG